MSGTRLTKDDIAAVIVFEINQARGYDADVLATKRQKALDFYFGLMEAPTSGRSSIVSMDVADAVHSTMAQIQPIVKTTLLEFEPDSETDEPMAQAESDFVRNVIERNGGYESMFNVCHDALLIGNGWLKVYVEEETKLTTQTYPGQLDELSLYLLEQPQHEEEVVTIEIDDDETVVTREFEEKRICFECIPPEDMIFADKSGASNINATRFVAQRKLMSVSDLRDEGYSQETIDKIPDAMADLWPAAVAREGIYQNEMDNNSAQDAERLKEVYCGYIRLDRSGNGKTELRYFWVGGAELLKNKPATHIPYITGSALPMPHRVQGTGIYELLASIQIGKTHVLRQYMDNLEVMNGSRVQAVEGQVNMKDLTNGRLNGIVRVKSQGAVAQMPSADIGMQAMAGLNYLDQVRVQRVGSSIDLNEMQAQIMQSSATAAAGALANVEKMAGFFANNLVETLLKPAFLLVHRLLRSELGGDMGAKIRGKWQQTNTNQWPERKVLAVTMGMTTVERTSRMQALTALLGMQQQILQGGGAGVLTDNSKMYNAMCDWSRANNLTTPQEYFIDPTSPEAQQAQQNQAMAAQQQSQQQQQTVVQIQEHLIKVQGQVDAMKQDKDLRYKVWADKLDAEVKEAEMTGKGIVQMADLRLKAVSDANNKSNGTE